MSNKKSPTGVVPPSYPGGGSPEVEPAYDHVEDIIQELWDYCMDLELEYYRTQDRETLIEFALCIGLIQYWEDVLLSMGGFYVFSIHF